jgi:hypothetical protein
LRGEPRIALMVITDGRAACLDQTLASFDEMVGMTQIARSIIVNDCPDPDFACMVDGLGFDEYVAPQAERRGFAGAIQAGWDAIGDCDYVLHLEDDFTFEVPWNISNVATFLHHYAHIAQVALRRQAWNAQERAAGGVVEAWPDQFRDCHNYVLNWHWLEHTLFWTTNPSIYRRSIVELGWPQERASERIFGNRIKDLGLVNAYWGRREDPPWVKHIGTERTGSGY